MMGDSTFFCLVRYRSRNFTASLTDVHSLWSSGEKNKKNKRKNSNKTRYALVMDIIVVVVFIFNLTPTVSSFSFFFSSSHHRGVCGSRGTGASILEQ